MPPASNGEFQSTCDRKYLPCWIAPPMGAGGLPWTFVTTTGGAVFARELHAAGPSPPSPASNPASNPASALASASASAAESVATSAASDASFGASAWASTTSPGASETASAGASPNVASVLASPPPVSHARITGTGQLPDTVVPLPHSPTTFSPQQSMVPSCRRAQANVPPAATAVAVVMPCTQTGEEEHTWKRSEEHGRSPAQKDGMHGVRLAGTSGFGPSCHPSSSPQQETAPSLLSAQAKLPPADTATTPLFRLGTWVATPMLDCWPRTSSPLLRSGEHVQTPELPS